MSLRRLKPVFFLVGGYLFVTCACAAKFEAKKCLRQLGSQVAEGKGVPSFFAAFRSHTVE